jgi:hypothetical protein
MEQIDSKYAFPLFTHQGTTGYVSLGNKKNIPVSDLWSFWMFVIKKWSKDQKEEVSSFLLSLLGQAKYFYQAAEAAPLNSQPLLYYYSFLNLGKIIITINGKAGSNPSQAQFYHGINADISGKDFSRYLINIKSLSGTSNISVGYHLMTCYGDTLNNNNPTSIKIIDALENCLGIHRAYCLVHEAPEHFIRVIDDRIFKQGKKLIARLYLKERNPEILAQYQKITVTPATEKSPEEIYWEESVTMENYDPTKLDYYNLSQRLLKKGIWTYTDGTDYIMYLSSNDNFRYTSASLIYCLMFFFGSITRYHPHLFESYLSEEYIWLIAEFLKTQPKQLLYISTSLITESYIIQPQGTGLLV